MIKRFIVLLVLFSQFFLAIHGQVSVSGLSAGGFMAVQYHVAFSSQLDGAGIVAGGPYYCAQGQMVNALISCMTMPSGINMNTLIVYTTSAVSKGLIDSTDNLENQKVWLFSGKLDSVVVPGVMNALSDYYSNYVASTNIVEHFNLNAQHAFPTDDYGNACNKLGLPYINNCNFDAAESILSHIYGSLQPATTAPTSNLVTLAQSKYAPSGWTISSMSLGSSAYYYLPSQGCTSTKPCKLHIALHGCQQTIADIGMDYVEDTGFNGWAESNNIIVLYPQAVKSYFLPTNPNGCFDWWGYTNANYATKLGPQMATINNMVSALKSLYSIA